MGWIKTEFKDLWIFEPKVFGDERGYFFESFNQSTFSETGLKVNFLQDNEAKSTRGVLRGLHYQVGKFAQSKLVRVVYGEVLDVVVDLRQGSDTYGRHFKIILSGQNKKQLFVPKGFAHGYVVLSDEAVFVYKCDEFYSKESEGGIIYNDKSLKIDWLLPEDELILSEKDMFQTDFENHKKFYL
jgi:dTDP-4-dehydrorhamnose 3,5-epimerase